MAVKTELTFEEVIKVAYLYHIEQVEQHALSVAFSVNAGRISEAAQAMEYCAANYRRVYKDILVDKDEKVINYKEKKT